MFSGLFGRKEIEECLKTRSCQIRVLKSFFLYNIALWIRVYIHENSLSLIDGVDWLGPF